MKKIACILFTLNLFVCHGQVNYFSSNKSKWSQQIGYWNPIIGGMQNYNYYYSNYFINGDTTVNNKLLQKLFFAGSTTKIDTTCYSFEGYIVNDSNKIYEGIHADSLVLVYDYNLVKGDSFLIYGSTNTGMGPQAKNYYPKVDSITTINYAGKNRKWIRFSLLPYNTRITWIEGVGDISYGLVFNYYYSIMFFNSLNTSLSAFNCFYDGMTLMSNGNCLYSNCNYASINTYDLKNEDISVYPNPVTGEKMNVLTLAEINNFTLYDLCGKQLIIEKTKTNSGYMLTLPSNIAAGIYFIEINKESDRLRKKIIVQH